MFTPRRLSACSFVVLCLLSTGRAQRENPGQTPSQTSTSVTASATAERVRFTAPSNVVRMQLRVVAETGQILFEVSSKGNVLDWTLQDGNGQRLQGSYLTVVTVKSLSGRVSERIGTVSVADQQVELKPLEAAGLTAAQQQAVGPVEENSALTILKAGETPATTVLANDGKDGHMIRGRGALTFRIGDFFSGLDTEQMRLTEDGRLGIGTSEPQAKLDVAGTIRAERFLIAKPKSAGGDRLQADTLAAGGGFETLITGTGTQNRIAKWTDNAGTLGDSTITETGGNVGIGTTTPGSKLVVSANPATLPAASGIARFADADGVQTAVFADAFGTNPIFNVRRANGTAAAPSAVQANQLLGVIGASGYGASAYMGTRARVGFFASENWTNTANGSYLTFNTTANGAATAGGAERMRIDNAGNVGIGTSAPAYPLSVSGNSFIGPSMAVAEFSNGATDTGLRLRNTTAGGRAWTLFSSGTGSGINPGRFNIYDANVGASRFSIDGAGHVGIGPLAQNSNLTFPLNVSGSSNIFPGVVTEFKNSEYFTSLLLTNELSGANSAWGVGAFRSTWNVNPGGFSIVDWVAERVPLAINRDGRIGIGTLAPAAALQVRNTPIDSGNATFFNGAGAMFATANNNGGSNPTGSETALVLAREGISGQAFANFARFNLNRFEIAGTAPRTQLDIGLAHDDLFGEANNTPTILTLRSNGNVGIRNTNPKAALDVNGDIKANNLQANNFPRIFNSSGAGFPDFRSQLTPGTTYLPLDQIEVNIVGSGYLHITATMFPYQFTGPQLCASAELRNAAGGQELSAAIADVGGSRSSLHMERVIPVTPGTYTFQTRLQNCSNTNMDLSHHNLTAVFIGQ